MIDKSTKLTINQTITTKPKPQLTTTQKSMFYYSRSPPDCNKNIRLKKTNYIPSQNTTPTDYNQHNKTKRKPIQDAFIFIIPSINTSGLPFRFPFSKRIRMLNQNPNETQFTSLESS